MTKVERIARRIAANVTLDDIYHRLVPRADATAMLDAMRERARGDAEYAEALSGWLDTGGTVVLRDILCDPFKGADFLDGGRRYPWWDAFTAIDTARLNASVGR